MNFFFIIIFLKLKRILSNSLFLDFYYFLSKLFIRYFYLWTLNKNTDY